ncbi:GDSL-type esterase/lipase family protein [Draconibacterium mangrovi]|uniref:GDSL-type esterase/lipase family protein n=1 Tax=Draconibacterium mangrovi TaxID=2697469 RepID=UPI0013D5DC49|nr:GDSL-type esterase/lipase family protein [Draconibacterium mangrovi]
MKFKILLGSFLMLMMFCVGTSIAGRVVVIGSSTAFGTGCFETNNAWVNRYRYHVTPTDPSNVVINLAVGGFTTYDVMPTDFDTPDGRPVVDVEHNITKALYYQPDVIIVNLPTNDVASGYSVEEVMGNFIALCDIAEASGIKFYVATSQPRNFTEEKRNESIALRDSINNYFGEYAIDFWTDLASEDGTINPLFDPGDGVHLNDTAHLILFNRVKEKDVLEDIETPAIAGGENTVNVDFGGPAMVSGVDWNNIFTYYTSIVNLTNSELGTTGMSLKIHDSFNGVNTSGTRTPDASSEFDTLATGDSFYGNTGAFGGKTEPTGGITLYGLNPNIEYKFTFFASRMGVNDNRETKYQVVGKTTDEVLLNTTKNTSEFAMVENILPDGDSIVINVSPGPNNTNSLGFYYLGLMRINYTDSLTTAVTDFRMEERFSAVLYPNPTSNDIVHIKLNSQEDIELNISVFDMAGKAISMQKQRVYSNNTIVGLSVSDLSPGNYIISLAGFDTKFRENMLFLKR